MEKIVISVEEEKAFKEFVNRWAKKTPNEIFKGFIFDKKHGDYITGTLKPLNKISEQDFFFILHGWYEVEQPKFKVGDWVYGIVYEKSRYYKITEESELDERRLSVFYANDHQYHFDKVTEEWKIVLLELGREKPELKKGDKIINIRDVNIEISEERDRYDFRQIKYLYPVESRIEIKQ